MFNKGFSFSVRFRTLWEIFYIYIYIYIRAILSKSWRQHPTKQQLHGHLPPITKTIKVRRTRHGGHSWRRREALISDVLQWASSHGRAKARGPSRTYIRDVVLKTYRKQWTIGRGGKRGSGISVLMAWHDDILLICWLVLWLVNLSWAILCKIQLKNYGLQIYFG